MQILNKGKVDEATMKMLNYHKEGGVKSDRYHMLRA